ncbi:MAG: hypothetical protein KA384_05645 [Leptotrichiaceae bacterium]|nr:hypothetical protein [Leptotrichiaceae bacterium]
MYSFVISMDNYFKDFGIMAPYMYPYMKDEKFEFIYTEEEKISNVFKNIKFSMQNRSSKGYEYQIIFVLSSYNNHKFCSGNLTNQINKIKLEILEKLKKVDLKCSVQFLVLDGVIKDSHRKPEDIEEYVALELDAKGYIDVPYVSHSDIERMLEIIFHSNESEKNPEIIIDEIRKQIFDKKKELIEKESVEGLAKYKNIEIHEKIINKLSQIIKELEKIKIMAKEEKKDNKEKTREFIYEIIARENYFFNYLFSKGDIEELKLAWGKGPDIGKDEEINDNHKKSIETSYEKIKKCFHNIVEAKKQDIQQYIKNNKNSKNDENIYLQERKLDNLIEEFERRYNKNYLKNIMEKGNVIGYLNKNKDLNSPINEIEEILKENYSLSKSLIEDNYRFISYEFIKNDKNKANENLVNIVYLIQFLIEYGEKRETDLRKGKIFRVEGIELDSKLNEIILKKYDLDLEAEKKTIDNKIQLLKKNIKIELYEPEASSLSKPNIKEIEIGFGPEMIDNEINDFDSNNKIAEEKLTVFIKEYESELIKYQENKMRLKPEKNSCETDNLEFTLDEMRKKIEIKRDEMVEMEKEIEITVKNDWIAKSKEGKYREKLERFLNIRPRGKVNPALISAVLVPICAYGFFTDLNIISLSFQIILFISTTMLTFTVHKNNNFKALKTLEDEIKRDYQNYSGKIEAKFEKKKNYIDKQVEHMAAERNIKILKNIQKIVGEEILKRTFYQNEIDKYRKNIEKIKEVFNNSKNKRTSELLYNEEEHSIKKDEIDYEKAPFENNLFIPSYYCGFPDNRKINIIRDEHISEFNPKNMFGCSSIKLKEQE